MQPLPTPCPPGLVPDASDVDAFNAAYRRAKQQHQVFVAVAEQGRRWTVKADTLTAGQDHTIVDSTYDAIRAAVFRLIRSRQIRADSSADNAVVVHMAIVGPWPRAVGVSASRGSNPKAASGW